MGLMGDNFLVFNRAFGGEVAPWSGRRTTAGGTRLLRAAIATSKMKPKLNKASVIETDEADGFIGAPNPLPHKPV